MPTKSIQIRLDADLKKNIEEICKNLGIDIPTAIRMFFKKMETTRGIPFSLKEEHNDEYTAEELAELKQAYEESFDPKNLSPAFSNVDDMIAYLNSHDPDEED